MKGVAIPGERDKATLDLLYGGQLLAFADRLWPCPSCIRGKSHTFAACLILISFTDAMPTRESTQQDLIGIGTHLYTPRAQGCTAGDEEKRSRASIGAMGGGHEGESDMSTFESFYSEVEVPNNLPASGRCLLSPSRPREWAKEVPSNPRVAELGKCRRSKHQPTPPRSVPASKLTLSGITDPTANDLIDKPEFEPTVLSAHAMANAAPTPGCIGYTDLPIGKERSILRSQLSGSEAPESVAWGEWEPRTERHSEDQ